MLEPLQGRERLTYHNEGKGFTIARLKVKGFCELVTAIGNLLAPIGHVLQITGEWKTTIIRAIVMIFVVSELTSCSLLQSEGLQRE